MSIVIPTLSGGPNEILTDDMYQILYTIRHFLLTPGGTSSFFENTIPSFRKLEASCKDDLNTLVQRITIIYQQLFNDRYNGKYTVEVTYNKNTDEPTADSYELVFNVTDSTTGKPVIPVSSFVISNNFIKLNSDIN